MLTLGFAAGRSNAVTLDELFADINGTNGISTYIAVSNSGTEGSIVYVNSSGETQYLPYAYYGWNPIAATKVLTSVDIDGTVYSTTATNLIWAGSGNYA